jgi:L-lactate utilization protein LutC
MGVTMHTMSVPDVAKRICLIDTPGFNDTNRTDADILQEVAYWLVKSYQLGIRLNGIIYLHNITDVRMTGSAVRGLSVFKAICGAENFYGVTMATTFWDLVEDIEKADQDTRELRQNPRFWKDFVDGKCTTRSLSAGKTSAMELVTAIAHSDKRLILKMQRELVDEGLLIYETDAGRELKESWTNEKSSLHTSLDETRKEIAEALAASEAEREKDKQESYDKLWDTFKRRKDAMAELEEPTETIIDRWEEKAMKALEQRKKQYELAQEELEEAELKLTQIPSDTSEYEEQEEIVEELSKKQAVADRQKSIQIASHTLTIGKASLGTAVASGLVGVAGVAVALAPLLCNVM